MFKKNIYNKLKNLKTNISQVIYIVPMNQLNVVLGPIHKKYLSNVYEMNFF